MGRDGTLGYNTKDKIIKSTKALQQKRSAVVPSFFPDSKHRGVRMKNFRVKRVHIICLAIATAEILIVAFVLWKNALWDGKTTQTAKERSALSVMQSETQKESVQGDEQLDTQASQTAAQEASSAVQIQASQSQGMETSEDTKKLQTSLSMRVKLKSSDNTSYEHAQVVITCPDTFHLQSGTKEQIFTGGQSVTITPQHPFFQEGHIRVASEGGYVTIDSILRRGICHEYEGVLDLYAGEQGILIVNELPLEAYVSKVVPSEMPASYGIEAAKLQAVCARTYAYERILHQKTIDSYGSYVDDSVDYQVYNSAGYQEISAQGAMQTAGVIMMRDGEPIVPYYFSTSCGYTSDNLAWSGNQTLPYLISLNLTGQANQDMTDEAIATASLQDWDAPGLESGMAWYRWRCEISLETLQMLFLQRLPTLRADQSACVQVTGGSLETVIKSSLKSIQVTGRFAGGMASGVQVTYEAGQVTVSGELIIRRLLGAPDRTYQNKSKEGVSLSEGDYLPSAFFCLIPVTKEGTVSSYVICGGGNGHGIGLSQNAAYQLLEQGKTWQEILSFFYQGIAFDTISC